MNWVTFWSAFLGTTLPAACVSLLALYLTYRTNRTLEGYKSETAKDLARYKSLLDQQSDTFSLWHEKRAEAMLSIYEAFRIYLAFLRTYFYFGFQGGQDVTPMHDFHDAIEKQLVYLDEELRQKILKYRGELLVFWNWAQGRRKAPDQGLKEVQERLDHEIPQYLEKLRKDIDRLTCNLNAEPR